MRFNPSGNSKIKVISNPLAGELRYLYTSQSLPEGYFQRYSFFSSSNLLDEDSRTSLVTRESPLAKLKKKKNADTEIGANIGCSGGHKGTNIAAAPKVSVTVINCTEIILMY